MKNNLVKINNVQLPFFYGFYESPLCNGDYIDSAIDGEMEYYRNECNEEHKYDDFVFNFEKYKKEITNCFVNAFKNYLPSWIKEIDNPEVESPKSYNFTTDKVFVTATLQQNWKTQIEQFVKENHEWLKERIRKDWTNRDGFFSFIDNDMDSFMGRCYALDSKYVSIIMQYDIELKNKSVDMYNEMAELTLEDFNVKFCDSEFVSLNNEKNES